MFVEKFDFMERGTHGMAKNIAAMQDLIVNMDAILYN